MVSSVHAAGDAGSFFEDALKRFEKKDYPGAVIQLKNALQQDPNSLQAHLLLGRAQLAEKNPAAAEDSFRKALALGVNRSEIAEYMATAMMMQFKFDELLAQVSPDALPAAARTRVLLLRAQAQMETRAFAPAAASLDEALKLEPHSTTVLSSLARLAQKRGDFDAALRFATRAVTEAKPDPSSWNTKASIELARGDAKAALRTFDEALKAEPKAFDLLLGRAGLYLDLKRNDVAAKDIALMQEINPDEPRAAYLAAIVAARVGDDRAAREQVLKVTKLVDAIPIDEMRRVPQLMLFGGLAHHGMGQFEKARKLLQSFVRVEPGHVGARKILASIMIADGDGLDALTILEPMRAQAGGDASVLALLASAYTAAKRYQSASEVMQAAVQAKGTDPLLRADLGISLLRSGKETAGFEQLERAYQQDPGQSRSGVALAMMHLQQGSPKRAREIMEAVVKREPRNAGLNNLLGFARLSHNDRPGARAAFTEAVRIDNKLEAARIQLASLDLTEGKTESARASLAEILRDNPSSGAAYAQLAAIDLAAGRRAEGVRSLQKALDVTPTDIRIARQLVNLYFQEKDKAKALEAARTVASATRESLDAQALLVDAQLMAGDPKKAQAILNQMTRAAGFDVRWLLRIAQAQRRAGANEAALHSLEKALTQAPDSQAVLLLAGETELALDRPAKAEARAKELLARYPASASGHRLNGDIAMSRGKPDDAIAPYKAALAKEDSLGIALMLFRAQIHSANPRAGVEFLDIWSKKHGEPGLALRALAEGYLRINNPGAAGVVLQKLVAKQPGDAAVLNNLANVLLQTGDLSGALTRAEAAQKAAPQDPRIADTLGWIHVKKGDVEKGLRYLRDARLRSPGSSEIRYHLAVALAQTGRNDEARAELEEALKRGEKFDGLDEARKLAAKLDK